MDLTIPAPESTDFRDILNRSIKALMLETPAIVRRVGSTARNDAAAFLAMIRFASVANPGALLSAFRRPSVSAPLRCMRTASGARAEELFYASFAALAFDLALAGALERPITLLRSPPRILSFVHDRSLRASPPLTLAPGMTVEDTAIAVSLSERIVLALADDNPIATLEAHPEKTGNALDLGAASITEWTTGFQAALATVERHLPALRAEMDLLPLRIVPVGAFQDRHFSASYREAIGTIYASLHPSTLTLAEALLHEMAHTKLNALLEIDPILTNGEDEVYTSPIRPDPRPLRGVLLALHAFLPVAALVQAALKRDSTAENPALEHRLGEVIAINNAAADILFANARPTALGAELLADLARWVDHFRSAAR